MGRIAMQRRECLAHRHRGGPNEKPFVLSEVEARSTTERPSTTLRANGVKGELTGHAL
jgi:hypothetical protein